MGLSSRFGDADMINFCDEEGVRIPPTEVAPAIGTHNAHRTETIGARYFIPFSSMHTLSARGFGMGQCLSHLVGGLLAGIAVTEMRNAARLYAVRLRH